MKLVPPSDGGQDSLAGLVAGLRSELRDADPAALAARIGAGYRSTGEGEGELLLELWGRKTIISFPGLVARDAGSGKESAVSTQALLLHHSRMTDGSSETGSWVSLAHLPDGTFYHRAFQGYTGDKLVRAFRNDLEAFAGAAATAGGRRESSGDAAFSFRALPRVPLMAVYWRGDEEFPPSAQLLFDSSVSHHLPTDVCAIVGATLTGRLIKAGRH